MKKVIIVMLVAFGFSQNISHPTLPPTVVNISNWTWGGGINQEAYDSGWGMPIVQQLSITREDQVIHGLLHTTNWDYGFNQSYTFNQIGAQTSFEFGSDPTFGIASSGAITRPQVSTPLPPIQNFPK